MKKAPTGAFRPRLGRTGTAASLRRFRLVEYGRVRLVVLGAAADEGRELLGIEFVDAFGFHALDSHAGELAERHVLDVALDVALRPADYVIVDPQAEYRLQHVERGFSVVGFGIEAVDCVLELAFKPLPLLRLPFPIGADRLVRFFL